MYTYPSNTFRKFFSAFNAYIGWIFKRFKT